MAKPRSAIAVRGRVEALVSAALSAFGVTEVSRESFDDFDDVIDFTQVHCEELGGEEAQDTWHCWQVGDFAVLGDLSLSVARDFDGLRKLSAQQEEVAAALLDSSFGELDFSVYADGSLKRRLAVEEDELIEEGVPVVEERGHFDEEFDDEALERLWTSRGLPTFEHDPLDGPFTCIVISTR